MEKKELRELGGLFLEIDELEAFAEYCKNTPDADVEKILLERENLMVRRIFRLLNRRG